MLARFQIRNVDRCIPMFVVAIVAVALSTPSAAYEFLGNKKWEPGLNTVSVHSMSKINPPMSPGGASWSAIPTGVAFSPDAPAFFFPDGATTTDLEFLITPAVDGLEYSIFEEALNVWASAAGITNLGKVADGAELFPGSALIGDTDANHGHVGDIRVAALPFYPGELARGFSACVNNFDDCDAGGSVGGDVFFDVDETWVDDPNDDPLDIGFDFFTVALHEIGHALGLNHSFVSGSVMEAVYDGSRRSLTADDIEGIIALYGPVPEPGSAGLALLGAMGILLGRRRSRR